MRALSCRCFVLSLLFATSTETAQPESLRCVITQPSELSVLYQSEAQFVLESNPGQERSKTFRPSFRVALNGEIVLDEVICPAQFKLKGLSPGMYTLSLQATGEADGETIQRSFYIAHEMFWKGRHHSPLPRETDDSEGKSSCVASSKFRGMEEREAMVQGEQISSNRTALFWVVMAAWNAENWIGSAIRSLQRQSYCQFRCLIINDASNDSTAQTARDQIGGDSRFEIITNIERKGAAHNMYSVLRGRAASIDDDDVIVILDADDWLADKEVLAYLAQGPYSENQSCWMTYGSLVYFPAGIPSTSPAFPPNVIQSSSYRTYDWISTHLRTFKFRLWRHLGHKTFQTSAGEWLPMTVDMATMFPMLEMAAGRACAVERSLCVYNMANPSNDFRVNETLQLELEKEIRAREPYQPLLWWTDPLT